MPQCPTCGEQAEHGVYENESDTFPSGPKIRICHGPRMAYVHVIGGE